MLPCQPLCDSPMSSVPVWLTMSGPCNSLSLSAPVWPIILVPVWLSYVISPSVTHHVSPSVTHPVRPCMTCHTGQPLCNLPYATPLCCQHPCDQPCQSLYDSLKLSAPLYLPHVRSLTSLGLSTLIPPRKWLSACRNSEQRVLERGSQTCQIWILGREFNPKIMPTNASRCVEGVTEKNISAQFSFFSEEWHCTDP